MRILPFLKHGARSESEQHETAPAPWEPVPHPSCPSTPPWLHRDRLDPVYHGGHALPFPRPFQRPRNLPMSIACSAWRHPASGGQTSLLLRLMRESKAHIPRARSVVSATPQPNRPPLLSTKPELPCWSYKARPHPKKEVNASNGDGTPPDPIQGNGSSKHSCSEYRLIWTGCLRPAQLCAGARIMAPRLVQIFLNGQAHAVHQHRQL